MPKNSDPKKATSKVVMKQCDQVDVADQLATLLKEQVAYDTNTALWRMYGDGVWRETNKVVIQKLIKEAIVTNFSSRFGVMFLNGVMQLLSAELQSGQWDSEVSPQLIPFKNGVLDMQSREFTHSHEPKHKITWQLPYNFDTMAICPSIMAWLQEVTNNDEDLLKLIRAFFLAVVLGRYDLQRYVEVVGPGGSGKGTLIRLLMAILGERNYYTTTLDQLEKNRFEMAALYGKRLVMITDASKFGGDGSAFKSLTGQDALRFEAKGKQHTGTFVYHGMVVIAANSPIYFSDTSGISRRRISIEFNHIVPASKRRNLSEEFEREIPGLLNWVLDMTVKNMEDLLRNTDTLVKSSFEAKITTLIDTNPIFAWLSENVEYCEGHKLRIGCLGVNDTFENAHRHLYPNFMKWCKENGKRTQMATSTFSIQLKELLNVTLGIDIVEWRRRLRLPDDNKTSAGFIGLKLAEGTENSIIKHAHAYSQTTKELESVPLTVPSSPHQEQTSSKEVLSSLSIPATNYSVPRQETLEAAITKVLRYCSHFTDKNQNLLEELAHFLATLTEDFVLEAVEHFISTFKRYSSNNNHSHAWQVALDSAKRSYL